MDSLTRRGAIGVGVISGPAILSTLARAETKPGPVAPEVSIAIPLYEGDRPITIGPGRRFHVVLANRSDQPLRLWSDHCSWGWHNLAFEVSDDRGVRLIRRVDREWTKNFPIAIELRPGDQYVLEVTFDPGDWVLPWEGPVIATRRVRLRAIYRIEPDQDAAKKGVWTGKVESRADDYTIRDNRR